MKSGGKLVVFSSNAFFRGGGVVEGLLGVRGYTYIVYFVFDVFRMVILLR